MAIYLGLTLAFSKDEDITKTFFAVIRRLAVCLFYLTPLICRITSRQDIEVEICKTSSLRLCHSLFEWFLKRRKALYLRWSSQWQIWSTLFGFRRTGWVELSSFHEIIKRQQWFTISSPTIGLCDDESRETEQRFQESSFSTTCDIYQEKVAWSVICFENLEQGRISTVRAQNYSQCWNGEPYFDQLQTRYNIFV